MGLIQLPEPVHDQIRLLASAWKLSEAAVVAKLIDTLLARRTPMVDMTEAPGPEEHAVFAVYRGQRSEGMFNRTTEHLRITSGPGNGREYRTPTGAARAVVQAANPKVHPNRNGWDFWTVAATGKTLQTLRRRDTD